MTRRRVETPLAIIPVKFNLPISPEATSPLREGLVFAGLTIVLTWLFWVPGIFFPMGSGIGDFLLAIGSLTPLAVAIFLQIWLQKWTFAPARWYKTLNSRNIAMAIFVSMALFVPIMLLRVFQGTLSISTLLEDALGKWLSLIGLLVIAIAEEMGWRAYLLPRFKTLPLYLTNLLIGLLWFVWQLPLAMAGRYNESENFGNFFFAMFLYALFLTPFLNRVALRAEYNPFLSGITRAGLGFVIAIYFLQGRADPLSDTFGNLTIGWLLLLNLIMFSQLWLGKKAPADVSELERVMPLEIGN